MMSDVSSIHGDEDIPVEHLDAFSIRGDLWFVADGNHPTSRHHHGGGAGRGSKQLVVIESGRLEIFSSSSDNSRMLKGLTMRTIRRISWFVHDPLTSTKTAPLSAGSAAAASARGRGKTIASAVGRTSSAPGNTAQIPSDAKKYYYLVVEATYDNRELGTVAPAKRERFVFATDHVADFRVWMQFFDQVHPADSATQDVIEGRSVSTQSVDGDSTTSSIRRGGRDDSAGAAAMRSTLLKRESEKLASDAAEWKKKAIDFFDNVQATLALFGVHSNNNIRRGGDGASGSGLTTDAVDNWSAESRRVLDQLQNVAAHFASAASSSGTPQRDRDHGTLSDATSSAANLNAAGSNATELAMLHNKNVELQRLVMHYVRTETAACDVINDFLRRSRSTTPVLPSHGDTPQKLRALFSHLTKKLSAAWLTIASQPRSISSHSSTMQAPAAGTTTASIPSRSQSMETATTLPSVLRQKHFVDAETAGWVFGPPAVPDVVVDAALSQNLSSDDLVQLVTYAKSVVVKTRSEGRFIPPDVPVAQQLDVAMQHIKASAGGADAEQMRREVHRMLEAKTEYLLSEIGRLKAILEARNTRVAELEDATSRLEEAVGQRPITKDGPARDTERAVADILKLVESTMHVRLPQSSSNALKIRFAFDTLFLSPAPLVGQLVSPEELHAALELASLKSAANRRLLKENETLRNVQEDLHRQHHRELQLGRLASGGFPASSVSGDGSTSPLRFSHSDHVAQQLGYQEREDQVDYLRRELPSQQVSPAAATQDALLQDLHHWQARCAQLEAELARHRSRQEVPANPEDTVAASAGAFQQPRDDVVEGTTSHHRFVQLLTMKNRQISALQKQQAGGQSSVSQPAALQRQDPTAPWQISSFAVTEHAAISVIERVKDTLLITVPDGPTDVRLLYVADILLRDVIGGGKMQWRKLSAATAPQESTSPVRRGTTPVSSSNSKSPLRRDSARPAISSPSNKREDAEENEDDYEWPYLLQTAASQSAALAAAMGLRSIVSADLLPPQDVESVARQLAEVSQQACQRLRGQLTQAAEPLGVLDASTASQPRELSALEHSAIDAITDMLASEVIADAEGDAPPQQQLREGVQELLCTIEAQKQELKCLKMNDIEARRDVVMARSEVSKLAQHVTDIEAERDALTRHNRAAQRALSSALEELADSYVTQRRLTGTLFCEWLRSVVSVNEEGCASLRSAAGTTQAERRGSRIDDEGKRETARSEVERLTNELHAAKLATKRLTAELELEHDEVARLKRQLTLETSSASSATSSLEMRRGSLEALAADLREQLAAKNAQLQRVEDAAARLQLENQQNFAVIAELRHRLEESASACSRAQEEAQRLQQRIDQSGESLRTQQHLSGRELDELRRDLSARHAALEDASQQLVQLRQSRDRDVAAANDAQMRARRLWESETQQLQSRIDALQRAAASSSGNNGSTSTVLCLPTSSPDDSRPKPLHLLSAPVATPTASAASATEDLVLLLAQLCNASTAGSSVQGLGGVEGDNSPAVLASVLLTRLRPFCAWVMDRVVPFALRSTASCSSALDTLVWAVEGHFRLLQSAAPLFLIQETDADSGRTLSTSSSVHERSMDAGDAIAWRIRELSEAHESLCGLIDEGRRHAAVAFPSMPSGTAHETVRGLVECVQVLKRIADCLSGVSTGLELSSATKSSAALLAQASSVSTVSWHVEERIHTLAERAALGDHLLSVVSSLPSIVSSKLLPLSLQMLPDAHIQAPAYLEHCFHEIQAVLGAVEDSLVTSDPSCDVLLSDSYDRPSSPELSSPSSDMPRGPAAVKLRLMSVGHLESELKRARSDLRVVLDTVKRDHHEQLRSVADERDRAHEDLNETRRALRQEEDARRRSESEARNLSDELANLSADVERLVSVEDALRLRVHELELQVKRYDIDIAESLKHLGVPPSTTAVDAAVVSASDMNGSLLSAAVLTAERLRAMESAIVEAGWAIRPNQRAAISGVPSADGQRQSTVGVLDSTPRRSSLSPKRPSVSFVSNSPDAQQQETQVLAGGDPNALIAMCRSAAADTLALRQARETLSRQVFTLRTALEDAAFHLRVDAPELRSQDTDEFLSAVPVVAAAAQSTRQALEAAQQEAKHALSTAENLTLKLQRSEEELLALRSTHESHGETNALQHKQSAMKLRDLKGELDEWRRQAERLELDLAELRKSTTADGALLQTRLAEAVAARQDDCEKASQTIRALEEELAVLRPSLRDTAHQLEQLQRRFEPLHSDHSEAFSFLAAARQPHLRCAVDLAAAFTTLLGAHHVLHLELEELQCRRQIESRAWDRCVGATSWELASSLRSATMAASVMACSIDAVPETLQALARSEVSLRQQCGDITVGRRSDEAGATRSACILAMREVLGLLGEQEAGGADEDLSSYSLAAPVNNITDALVDVARNVSLQLHASKDLVASQSNEIRILREDIRRLSIGVDDTQHHFTATRTLLDCVALELDEATARRLIETRAADAFGALVMPTLISSHCAMSSVLSLLAKQRPTIATCPALVDEILNRQTELLSLAGDLTTHRREHASRETLLATVAGCVHALGGTLMDDDHCGSLQAAARSSALSNAQCQEQLRDTSGTLRRLQSELNDTTHSLRLTTEELHQLTRTHDTAALQWQEASARRQVELRAWTQMPQLQEDALNTAFHSAAAAVSRLQSSTLFRTRFARSNGGESVSMHNLAASCDLLCESEEHLRRLVGDGAAHSPTHKAVRRDKNSDVSRAACLEAMQASTEMLNRDEDPVDVRDLDAPSALLAVSQKVSTRLDEAVSTLDVVVPELKQTKEACRGLQDALSATEDALAEALSQAAVASLCQRESQDRGDIEHLAEAAAFDAFESFTAPALWAAMQAASIVASASVADLPSAVFDVSASEMRYKELVGEQVTSTARDTNITRASCIAAIMQAIAVLHSEVKGDILSSLLMAAASAAKAADEATVTIPALQGDLRKAKEDFIALQRHNATVTDERLYYLNAKAVLTLFWEEEGDRRLIERQAEHHFSSTILPVVASAASHAVRAANTLAVELVSMMPNAVKSLVDDNRALAHLAGDASAMPSEASRSELIETISDCFEALRLDVPRQNLPAALLAACRSASRQAEGDALTIQTVAADLRRTQEELSHYVLQSHAARDQIELAGMITAVHRLHIDELTSRSHVLQEYALEFPIEPLLYAQRCASVAASSLRVVLGDLPQEVNRLADDHVLLTAMVGDGEVGRGLGSREHLAEIVMRARDILKRSQLYSPSRNEQADDDVDVPSSLIAICHDMVDALNASRSRVRGLDSLVGSLTHDCTQLLEAADSTTLALRQHVLLEHQPLASVARATPIGRRSALLTTAEDADLPSPVVKYQDLDEVERHVALTMAAQALLRVGQDSVARVAQAERLTQQAIQVLETCYHTAAALDASPNHDGAVTPIRRHGVQPLRVEFDLADVCDSVAREWTNLRDLYSLASAELQEVNSGSSKLRDTIGESLSSAVTQCVAPSAAMSVVVALSAAARRTGDVDAMCVAVQQAVDALVASCTAACAAAVKSRSILLNGVEEMMDHDAAVRPVNCDDVQLVVETAAATFASMTNLKQALAGAEGQVASLTNELSAAHRLCESQRISHVEEVAGLSKELDDLRCAEKHKQEALQTITSLATRLESAFAACIHAARAEGNTPDDASLLDVAHGEAPVVGPESRRASEVLAAARRHASRVERHLVSAETVAETISSALRSVDAMHHELRALQQNLEHQIDRASRAEEEVARLHHRLEDSAGQFTTLQEEDAYRARQLRLLQDQIEAQRADFAAAATAAHDSHREALDAARRAAAESERVLEERLESQAVVETQLRLEISGLVASEQDLREELGRARDSCMSSFGSLATIYGALGEDSAEGCVKAHAHLVFLRSALTLQLEEAERRVAILKQTAVSLPAYAAGEFVAAAQCSLTAAASALKLRRVADLPGAVTQLRDEHAAFKALCGDLSQPSVTAVEGSVTRSDCILAISHALATLATDVDGGDSSLRPVSPFGTTPRRTVCEKLRHGVADLVDKSLGLQTACASLRREVDGLRETLSTLSNASIATYQALHPSQRDEADDCTPQMPPGGLPALGRLLVAYAEDMASEVRRQRAAQRRVSQQLLQARGAMVGPDVALNVSAATSLTDSSGDAAEATVRSAKLVCDELLFNRQRAIDLGKALDATSKEKERLLQAAAGAVSTLSLFCNVSGAALNESTDSLVASSTGRGSSAADGDNGDSVSSVAQQLEQLALEAQRLHRADRKRLADVHSAMLSGMSSASLAPACEGPTRDVASLDVYALAVHLSECASSAREDIDRVQLQLKRSELRAQQLKDDLAAQANRHQSELDERDEGRKHADDRATEIIEKLREQMALQRLRLQELEEGVSEGLTALRAFSSKHVDVASDSTSTSLLLDCCKSIRAELDALHLEHRSTCGELRYSQDANHALTADLDAARDEVRGLSDRLRDCQGLFASSKADAKAQIQQLEAQVAEQRTAIETLEYSLDQLRSQSARAQSEHEDAISRMNEVHLTEVELLSGRMRDKEEALLHLGDELAEAKRSLTRLTYDIEVHLRWFHADSLDDARHAAYTMRCGTEQLAVLLDEMSSRYALALRCTMDSPLICLASGHPFSGFTGNSMCGFALSVAAQAATRCGAGVSLADLPAAIAALQRKAADMQELLGDAAAASTSGVVTKRTALSRVKLLDCLWRCIAELEETRAVPYGTVSTDDPVNPASDEVSVPMTTSRLTRADLDEYVLELVTTRMRELEETQALLETRTSDVRRLWDESRQLTAVVEEACVELRRAKRAFPGAVDSSARGSSSLQTSPIKNGAKALVEDSSEVQSLTELNPTPQAARREVLADCKEVVENAVTAFQQLCSASQYLVPVALPHLRGVTALATLTENLCPAAQRASSELVALRDDKVVLIRKNELQTAQLECYLACAPCVLRCLAAAPALTNPSLNASFTCGSDANASSAVEDHQALCDELVDKAQFAIAELRRATGSIREAEEVLAAALPPTSQASDERTGPARSAGVSSLAMHAVERISALQHDVAALTASLRKAETKSDQLRGEVAATIESRDAQALQDELRVVALEQAHRDQLDAVKQSLHAAQKHVGSLMQFVSDVAHIGDVREDWDAEKEFLSSVVKRFESQRGLLEQTQQTAKHLNAELKQLRLREGDLQANRQILEHQVEQLNVEVEEQQKQSTLRNREHKKEVELLQRSIEELQYSLDRERDDLTERTVHVERLKAEIDNLHQVQQEEKTILLETAKEESASLQQALEAARAETRMQHDAFNRLNKDISAFLRDARSDTLDTARNALFHAWHQISCLELTVDEQQQRSKLLLKEAEGLQSVLDLTLYRDAYLGRAVANELHCEPSVAPTVLASLVASEVSLQRLQGDAAVANKTRCSRSAMVNALLDCRMYMGMPFDLDAPDDAFAQGVSVAVSELVEKFGALSQQCRTAEDALEAAHIANQALIDAAQTSHIILSGPLEASMLLASPTPHRQRADTSGIVGMPQPSPLGLSQTPSGRTPQRSTLPSRSSIASISSNLERAAHATAERCRAYKSSLHGAVSALCALLQSPASAYAPQSSDVCEALSLAVEKISKEVSESRALTMQQIEELTSLRAALDVYSTKTPELVRFVVGKITSIEGDAAAALVVHEVTQRQHSSPHGALHAAAVSITETLEANVSHALEEWGVATRVQRDIVDSLGSIQGVAVVARGTSMKTAPLLVCAAVVDVCRSLEASNEQRGSRVKQLEGKVEQLSSDLHAKQDDFFKQNAELQRTTKATKDALQTTIDRERETSHALQSKFRRLLGAALDAVNALHVDQDKISDAAAAPDGEAEDKEFNYVVDSLQRDALRVRSTSELLQQQNRRLQASVENHELEAARHGAELSAERERATNLANHLRELQMQRDSLESRHARDTEESRALRAELEGQLLNERRERESKMFDHVNKVAELQSSLQRIADACILNEAARSTPSSIADSCVAKLRDLEQRIQQHSEQATKLRDEIRQNRLASDQERSTLLLNLERATAECNERRSKEETLLLQLEGLLEQHSDLVASWRSSDTSAASSKLHDEPQTVFAVTSMCFAQLARRQKLLEITEKAQVQLETECAKLSTLAATMKEDKHRLVIERDELARELTALQRTFHGAEVSASSLTAEHDTLRAQVHKLYTACAAIAQKDLNLAEGSHLSQIPDSSSLAEVSAVMNIVQHIARRFRGAPTEDDMERVKLSTERIVAEERDMRAAASRLELSLKEKVVPLLLPPSIRQAHSRAASESSNSVLAVTAAFEADLLEVTTKTRDTMLSTLRRLESYTDAVARDHMPQDMFGLAIVLSHAVESMEARLRSIVTAGNSVAERLGTSALDISPSATGPTDWTRRWADGVLDAAMSGEKEAHAVLDKLADVMRSMHATVPDVSPSSLRDGALFYRGSDTVAARSFTTRRDSLFEALQSHVQSIIARLVHLTSEWQAMQDQNNRLQLENHALVSEREAVQAHVAELRVAVRKKLDDDRRAERQIEELDRHLEEQLHEALSVHKADTDIIQRLAANMKVLIHRTIRAPSVATSIGDAGPGRSVSQTTVHQNYSRPTVGSSAGYVAPQFAHHAPGAASHTANLAASSQHLMQYAGMSRLNASSIPSRSTSSASSTGSAYEPSKRY